MKILWIVNTIFPAPSQVLALPIPVFGGWMYGLAEQLKTSDGITLAVATTYLGNEITFMNVDGIDYYLLPSKNKLKYETSLEDYWRRVTTSFEPDLIHIHGTECAHGLSCMRSLPEFKYIISIQGLVSVISRYYYASMTFTEVFKNLTFRDFVRRDSIFNQQQKFKKRGELEKEYIVRAKNIIGRTNWDNSHIQMINPKIIYHFCNESLRDSFYSADKWSFDKCETFTIFLSQAGYPIKGLHLVIKAIALLKEDFPFVKVKIGGANITASQTLTDKLKISGYGKYLKHLIKRNKLEQHFLFLGTLTEQDMIAQYLKANIFICPSSIENSPNSLGEAQLIGVPVIASYVGGIPDMITHQENGLLYRFEEVEMLAKQITSIFNNKNLALKLSEKAKLTATVRHDVIINLEQLKSIYLKVFKFNGEDN